jgi:hypothetical protein
MWRKEELNPGWVNLFYKRFENLFEEKMLVVDDG